MADEMQFLVIGNTSVDWVELSSHSDDNWVSNPISRWFCWQGNIYYIEVATAVFNQTNKEILVTMPHFDSEHPDSGKGYIRDGWGLLPNGFQFCTKLLTSQTFDNWWSQVSLPWKHRHLREDYCLQIADLSNVLINAVFHVLFTTTSLLSSSSSSSLLVVV